MISNRLAETSSKSVLEFCSQAEPDSHTDRHTDTHTDTCGDSMNFPLGLILCNFHFFLNKIVYISVLYFFFSSEQRLKAWRSKVGVLCRTEHAWLEILIHGKRLLRIDVEGPLWRKKIHLTLPSLRKKPLCLPFVCILEWSECCAYILILSLSLSLSLLSPLICGVNYICGHFSTQFYHIFFEYVSLHTLATTVRFRGSTFL